MEIINWPLEKAGSLITGAPGVNWVVEKAIGGLVGLPGIPADIIALITLNQRAIGEYATYYGFDISSQQERLFALNILGLASSSNDAAKQVAMAQLVRIAQDVARKRHGKI